MGATSAVLAAVVGLAVMIGGPTATVLQPLRTITGSGGGGSSANVNASGATTTTENADAVDATRRRATTTVAGATTSTRRPGRTTTTAAPPSTTASTSSGSTFPTAIGDCKSGDLDYSTHTNKSTYHPNESVQISMAVTNSGQVPCYAPGPCGVGPWASVKDNNSGAEVWKNNPIAVACTNPPPGPPLLNPNDTHDYGTIATWDQICSESACSGQHARIGSYTAIGHRNGIDSRHSAVFALSS